MSSKRHVRRKACGDKRRFSDQASAIAAIRMMRAKGKAMGMLQAYRCKWCSSFHWGHAR
jgi:hypothetical protein